MAQTSHLKATAVTNLDATPAVFATAGEGAGGRVRAIGGYVTPITLDDAATTYQFCRVPTHARVKQVLFESEAQGAGKVQLGVYYSTSLTDGTVAANQLSTGAPKVVTSSGSTSQVNYFSGDIDCASAVGQADYTYFGTALNTLDKRNKRLWDACGLLTDPGGYFDIVGTVHTTTVTTGTGKMGVCVLYVD
jgi:hypothetical protein